MKKKLKTYILFLTISTTLISCKEEPTNPSDALSKNLASKTSEPVHFTLYATDSDEPLSINSTKNKSDNAFKYTVSSNISSKEKTGSISFNVEGVTNNSFFPENIEVSSNTIKYYFKNKNKTIQLDNKLVQLRQMIKNNREKRENRLKQTKINWTSLKPDEVVSNFVKKGYKVTELGDNRYEVSREFQPLENSNDLLLIKMIFNAKTGFPEQSELYRQGEKISESILRQENGKNIMYQKLYEKNKKRNQKNFISIEEF